MAKSKKGMLMDWNEAFQAAQEQETLKPQVPPDAEYNVENVEIEGEIYQVFVARLLINPKRLSQTKKSLILAEAQDETNWSYRRADIDAPIVFSGMLYVSTE